MGYEVWAPFQQSFMEGEYAAIADRASEVLADDPPYAALYYNFACAASLAGRLDQALAHLRRGLELSDELRAWAREDSDFDAVRDDPRFQELVAGPA
jgi:tetratricopeptide (TPR) repeat protein